MSQTVVFNGFVIILLPFLIEPISSQYPILISTQEHQDSRSVLFLQDTEGNIGRKYIDEN